MISFAPHPKKNIFNFYFIESSENLKKYTQNALKIKVGFKKSTASTSSTSKFYQKPNKIPSFLCSLTNDKNGKEVR